MKMTIDVSRTIADICDTVMSEMQQEALENHPDNLPFPNGIIQEMNNEIQYTEAAQAKFNELYKQFYSIIEDNKIN